MSQDPLVEIHTLRIAMREMARCMQDLHERLSVLEREKRSAVHQHGNYASN